MSDFLRRPVIIYIIRFIYMRIIVPKFLTILTKFSSYCVLQTSSGT